MYNNVFFHSGLANKQDKNYINYTYADFFLNFNKHRLYSQRDSEILVKGF